MDFHKITEAKEYILNQCDEVPSIGLILGSGLGSLADEIENVNYIPYQDIPHFPESTVKGHKGRLAIGKLESKTVMAMQGRFHYYEGYDLKEVTFPVRVMQNMGIDKLIVTNAAGGIDLNFSVGGLMLITDHINFFGANPLRGKNDDRLGTRFPDMTYAYDPELREVAKQAANELDIGLYEGVYLGVPGPSYETPAEIKMARTIGASAVGMSTVPEVIAANHGNMNVLGISCITNMAAGIQDKRLTHKEVEEVTTRVRGEFQSLVRKVLASM
ncbi:purine-nucleoside phosphorylase [Natranaerobius thermophilus]|uniref:Purine nucleoside phosphorylase n=1 Tax=Natranaerobius thermophilus (strain ATCC BAA-1301 / DSM 18059 / JW/NM-WN-LF) TaxID=457570 RepID=B2A4Z8_NATTJ|nr:purine-nucleoside phosphorylase [Natranaerobius thermophilus]ACB85240.1 inosine guanosine and xanthosine phosphorylase family [Natranaerobius thermophilus JW/NM-WN-LF]